MWIMEKLNVTWDQWQAPFDYFHYHLAGPYFLWILIAIHIGAALYHHYIYKDDVLIRMLPERKLTATNGETSESRSEIQSR